MEELIEKLAHMQPKILNEPQAYKRAVMRMAITEYMREQEDILIDAMERHG